MQAQWFRALPFCPSVRIVRIVGFAPPIVYGGDTRRAPGLGPCGPLGCLAILPAVELPDRGSFLVKITGEGFGRQVIFPSGQN